MSPEQKRKFNTVFGSVFLVTASVAWGLTAYFAFTPAPPKPAPVHREPVVDLGSCQKALQALGYQVSIVNSEVLVYEPLEPLLEGNQRQLEKSTAAVSVCHLNLKEFCMGEGCDRPGLNFTLARPQAQTASASAAVASTQPSSSNSATPAQAGK